MIQVRFTWERRPSRPAAGELRGLVRRCLERLRVGPAEVHVLVTDDRRLAELNRDFRGVEGPTDVLSFPDGDELPSGGRLLGEIAVSLDSARRQAVEFGHDELRELSELVLHGTLHLLGYDHHVDDGEMDELELNLRAELLS